MVEDAVELLYRYLSNKIDHDVQLTLSVLLRVDICSCVSTLFSVYSDSYFTTKFVHRKNEFMQIINSSCSKSGFTCSFTDRELAEFVQFKKRITEYPQRK